MTDLAGLAQLTGLNKLEPQIDLIGVGSHYDSDSGKQWSASVTITATMETFHAKANSLDMATRNLLVLLESKGFQVPSSEITEPIPNSEEINVLITELQDLSININDSWSLGFEYICIKKVTDLPYWSASVSTSRWGRGIVALAHHCLSFYEVCIELRKNLEEIKDELPYIH